MNDLVQTLLNNGVVLSKEPQKKADFILKDGSFVNLQKNRNVISYFDKIDVVHKDLVDFLCYKKEYDSNDTMRFKEEFGLIRLNDGNFERYHEQCIIDLPMVEPTKEQYDSLLKWIDFVSLQPNKNHIYVNIKQYELANKDNPDGVLPEDIIKDIKKYYNDL